MKNLNKFWTAIKISMGMLIFYILFKKVGITKIYESFTSMDNPGLYLTLGLLIIIITFILGAICLYILIIPIKKISLRKLFQYLSISWSVGTIMPAGDIISLTYLLKKEDIPLGPGLVITLLDKIITFLIISILAFFAILKMFSASYAINFSLTLIILSIIIASILSTPGRKFIRKIILHKYESKFAGFSRVLTWYLTNKKSLLFLNALVTLIKFIFTSLLFYVIIVSMGVAVSFLNVILITAALMTLQTLPSPLRVLGLKEGILVSLATLFYSQLGIYPAKIISAHIITVLLNYTYALITITVSDYRKIIKS